MSFRGRAFASVISGLAAVLGVTGLVPSPASAAPVVSSFTPTSGGVGTRVTVTGTGFTSVTAVKFNTTPATYTPVSSTQITAYVPPGASTGKISITAGGVTGTSSTSFTVTLGSSVSPAAGPPTTKVTVSGSGFGANEAVDLYAGTSDVALGVADANGSVSIPTAVPASAQPGTYWFTLVGRRSGNASQAAFTVRTNVAQSGYGPGKQSWNPYENTITRDNAGSLDNIWSVAGSLPPAVVDDVAFTVGNVGSGSGVIAYSNTGTKKWARSVANLTFARPAVIGSTVVVGTVNGHVVGLSTSNGAVQWDRQLASTAGINDGITTTASAIYVVQGDGRVTSLSPAGVVNWTAAMTASSTSAAAVSKSTGLVITGDSNGGVYEWSLATGGQSEAVTFSGVGQIETPVIAGNLVITATSTGTLNALDIHGLDDEAWSVSVSGMIRPPAIGNNRVYAAGQGFVEALSKSTGSVIWTSSVPTYTATPFLAGSLLWAVGGTSQVVALDPATGEDLGSVNSNAAFAPVVSDGVLYTVGVFAQTLEAFVPPDPLKPSMSARPNPRDLRPDYSLQAG